MLLWDAMEVSMNPVVDLTGFAQADTSCKVVEPLASGLEAPLCKVCNHPWQQQEEQVAP